MFQRHTINGQCNIVNISKTMSDTKNNRNIMEDNLAALMSIRKFFFKMHTIEKPIEIKVLLHDELVGGWHVYYLYLLSIPNKVLKFPLHPLYTPLFGIQ